MIVFDIDGTLSIVGDRLECLKTKNWDGFYDRCYEDEINDAVAKTLLAFKSIRQQIVYVTGRRESCRKDTLRWLDAFGLPSETKNLYMRKNSDYRHDSIVKIELVKPFISDIDIVFEDRDSMVKTWRDNGVTCFQVAEGNF